MKTVSIFGQEYSVRYGLRSLFRFEQMAGHPFTGRTLEETYLLFHASLMACNEGYTLTFDELITACDEDPTLFETFMQMVGEASKRAGQLKKKAVRAKR